MTVDIRPARPTTSDATAFAELANIASHDLISNWLGKNYRCIVAPLFFRCDNLFSHSHAHFAMIDGTVSGLLHAFSGRQKTEQERKTSQRLMRHAGLALPRMMMIGYRLDTLFSFMNRLGPDAFYIQALAVYPDLRGQGIGKWLLAKADELACFVQAKTIELDVETDNAVALSMYLGRGMKIAATSPTIYFQPQQREITVYRMVKPLNQP